MKENQIDTYTYDLEWNRFDLEYYRKAVLDIFERNIEFDGVFAVDALAIECMNETIRRHRKVPRDVKFVAYDGTFITEVVEPKMTAVVQPIDKLAKESVRLLGNLINGKVYKNKQVILQTQIKKGNTTVV